MKHILILKLSSDTDSIFSKLFCSSAVMVSQLIKDLIYRKYFNSQIIIYVIYFCSFQILKCEDLLLFSAFYHRLGLSFEQKISEIFSTTLFTY